ncbi:MAG TPA: peptidoglycan-binding domain-containing protein, partial [Candidatus Paceibacterota bacterium]|nr:peptidoglycan-binding domain-containing protein [Candidatus Paceibacterota bacterium]
MLNKTAIALVAPLVLIPLFVSAQTTDTQAQIASLSAELQSLEAELAALTTGGSQGTASVTSQEGTTDSNSSCYLPTQNLTAGSTGSAVIALQNFLIAQGDLSADDNTGFFGSATQSALQQWQSAHGIVSSGTPSTTGYGALGPKTRSTMSASCGATSSTASVPQSSPTDSANPLMAGFSATPSSGAAPLNVT